MYIKLPSCAAFSISPSICVSACAATEPYFIRLFLLLLSLVNATLLSIKPAFLLVERIVCHSTSVRLSVFDWSVRFFFSLHHGGGSEPLCPRAGTFLAKFSTV